MPVITVELERVKSGPRATTYQQVSAEGQTPLLRRLLKLDNEMLLTAGFARESHEHGFQAPEKIEVTVRT